MIKRTNGEKIFNIFNYLLLAVIGLSMLYPFIYTLSISLSTAAAAIRPGLHLYPTEFTLLSYKMVLKNTEIFPAYLNTIARTCIGTTFSLLMTSTFAYPLSRSEMPHRAFISFLVLFTMLFSGGVIPSYLLIQKIHLLDNRLVYILPTAVTAFNLIILKNHFQSLPSSLRESAKLDGANEFIILFRIILPLSKATLATLALWIAVGHWNMWFDSMIYITSPSKQVLQLFLKRVVLENQSELIELGLANPDSSEFTSETIKSATIIVAMLPVLLSYPFIQKYFTKGVMLGSVKG